MKTSVFCSTFLLRAVLVPLFLLLSLPAHAVFIAVSVSAEDNFRNLITSNIEATVDRKGDEIYIDAASGDFDLQYKQIKSYVEAGADAVIILSAGNQDQNQKLLEFAKQVPLVFVNVEPIADLSKMPPNSVYVGSNEEQSGTLEMEELARLAGYKGNVALLIGEPNHPAAKMRTLDVKNVMAKYPEMTLVKSETANWARNQAYKVVSGWIKENLDFKVLVANNDEMILGGIMALRDAGKDPKNYYTGGVDATPDALREMQAGNLDVTVLQDAVTQGITAVDVAYRLINGTQTEKTVWIPFRLVTPDNLENFIK
ncbi:ribose transport system substrate-binding protein [Vibrio xiamenensis]|uniref:Autoinducer 2-binding periplasmic protein LuxP n=1 Tax=Vibrio xiamenensis TaxID=861298 RepID=A0A1G7WT57_9VIBR|nr:substrate-binding domain-containing protein [Vibrio xiamenensis]SDG75089.1 ribose transport system substrate-binding protein [Vibrio xiamenensis]